MTTRSSMSTPSSRSALPQRSTFRAMSPYVTDAPWQRIATLSGRSARFASTYVSAALYRSPSSGSRSSPTRGLSPQGFEDGQRGDAALVKALSVPHCGDAAPAMRGERLGTLVIDVLEIDLRFDPELHDAAADRGRIRVADAVVQDHAAGASSMK